MANRADRLADALYQEREIVSSQPPGGPSGWGVGFYQAGEVLHKKRPRVDGAALDWARVTEGVRSDCVVLHVRQPTVGDFRSENTHPFRFKSWLFAHAGTIERFEALRPRLLESIPDFLRRSVRGATDSEVFFHLILAFLHDAGSLDSPDLDDKDAVSAIRSATRLVDRLAAEVGAPEASLNCILTNGRSMFALRRGAPMALVRREGLHELRPGISEPPGGPASSLRYVMLVGNGDQELPAGCEPLPPGTLACVDHDLDVTLHSL
jgi:glutamine amidotransferase